MKAYALRSMTLILAMVMLPVFHSAAVGAAEPLGPQPPRLIAPSSGAVLPQPQAGLWVFEWKPVRNARSYQIEVIGPGVVLPLINAVTSSTQYVVPRGGVYITDLQGWTWRVRTQDEKGVWGDWSESRKFSVAPLPTRPASPSASTGYYIRGELRDAAGNLVPASRVCVRETRGRICSSTDTRGRFVLVVGGEGRYEVSPGELPIRPSTDTFMPSDAYPAVRNGSEVTLDSAHREANIVLTMPERNPELVLKVVDDTTQLPVELALIKVCYANQWPSCGGRFFRSDTGEYNIYVPPKDFGMSVRAPDYEEWASVENKGMKPGSAQSVEIVMRRSPEAAGEALHESEKKVGIHLNAPVQLAPGNNETLLGFPRTTTLQWEKVEGASRYEVEVDYCLNSPDPKQCVGPTPLVFAFPFLREPPRPNTTKDTSLTVDFVGSQPGRWRVWAVDKDGRRGFKSPWRMFTYAR